MHMLGVAPLGGKCCREECTRTYSAAAVHESASLWRLLSAAVQLKEHAAHVAAAEGRCRGHTDLLDSGGWCLASGRTHRKRTRVKLPNNQSYLLPGGHFAADETVVAALHRLLSPSKGSEFQSLLDLGAGVGQYGHALLALDLRHRYAGYDGAGDVENVTVGFVRYADLTTPLMVPRADWVFSAEVGEHIPPSKEQGFVRNLHALNCRGIVLSWELPSGPKGKITGHGHVNCHSQEYVRLLLQELGYRHDSELTADIRGRGVHGTEKVPHARRHLQLPSGWRDNVFAFRRIVPLHC